MIILLLNYPNQIHQKTHPTSLCIIFYYHHQFQMVQPFIHFMSMHFILIATFATLSEN